MSIETYDVTANVEEASHHGAYLSVGFNMIGRVLWVLRYRSHIFEKNERFSTFSSSSQNQCIWFPLESSYISGWLSFHLSKTMCVVAVVNKLCELYSKTVKVSIRGNVSLCWWDNYEFYTLEFHRTIAKRHAEAKKQPRQQTNAKRHHYIAPK